jgi:hypothetical protein
MSVVDRDARTRTARNARIREGLWMAAMQLVLLPLIADRVPGWFLRTTAELAGFVR